MAVYHYVCSACNFTTEVVRSVSELEVLPVCDVCSSVMKRLYAIGGVEFKGDGWGKD